MSEKRYVVGLGEALWDVLPEGKKLGGAPANFAYHAGQFLGSDNAIAISALGEKEDFRISSNIIAQFGVFNCGHILFLRKHINVYNDGNSRTQC